MLKSFKEIIEKSLETSPKKIAVAVAQDEHVLEALFEAHSKGIAEALLVGDAKEIRDISAKLGHSADCFDIVDEQDVRKATMKAVELVSSGSADILMKGYVDTATFLRGLLDKKIGLRTDKLISHVGVFEAEGFDRLLFITDAAFNTYPDLKAKADIARNAAEVARSLGGEQPKIAVIGAVEVVNPDMQATMDAAALSKMNERGQIKNCIIDGPLALDNALSPEAAAHKKITSLVAGRADILLMPDIEAGNIMYKSLSYVASCKNAGILMGASSPVIVTSRTDSFEAKVNTIALAAAMSQDR